MDSEKIKISELRKSKKYTNWELQLVANGMIYDLIYKKLNLCGCGSPVEIAFMIKDILKAINNKTNNNNLDFDIQWKQYDMELFNTIGISSSNIVYEFVLKVLDSVDVLEHGGSIGGAWLSDYGKELLCAYELINEDFLDEYVDLDYYLEKGDIND